MKALVYQGPGKKVVEERPIPEVKSPTDAIVKVSKTTICGTDLHILKGDVPACCSPDVPTCSPGRILGHEGVGVVGKTGPGVTMFHPGDSVLISCISACGKCEYCRRRMYSHCTTGGWILGNEIDGTQAEYVRIPHADTSLYRMPAGIDEDALVMLSDILPTGFKCGALNGKVQPSNSVAIVGAGPIGLAALLTAQLYSPAEIIMIDLDDRRLQAAKGFGATATINAADRRTPETVMKNDRRTRCRCRHRGGGRAGILHHLQGHLGPRRHYRQCPRAWRQSDLHLEYLWSRNITITTRLVDTATMPMLLKAVQSRKLDPKVVITHHFQRDAILDA